MTPEWRIAAVGAIALWLVTEACAVDARGLEAKSDARPARLPVGCSGSELLYEDAFSAPKEARDAAAAKDWVMEGGGIAEWADGYLRLRSKHYTPARSSVETDHFVYWLKRDFPADAAAEWDFRFPDWAVSPNGLAILFLCAQGARGEDLFDPKLAARDGVFARYHSGDINCYHVSYFAGKRGKANVRKNAGFHLVASADDLVASGGPEKWHRLLLSRFGGRLELTVDGKPCLSWADDGRVCGPLLGGGKIGLRQQNDLLWGDYANLRVYGLKR